MSEDSILQPPKHHGSTCGIIPNSELFRCIQLGPFARNLLEDLAPSIALKLWTGPKNVKFWRAGSYAGVVFTRYLLCFSILCHVLKEFSRLRSRYVLVLLFPKQTNFSFFKQPLDPTLPFLAHKHSHCCKGSTFWASPSTFFMKWREDHYLKAQCAHQAQQKLRNLLSSTGPG